MSISRAKGLNSIARFNSWPSSNFEILQTSELSHVYLLLHSLTFQWWPFLQNVASVKGPKNLSCWSNAPVPCIREHCWIFCSVVFPCSEGFSCFFLTCKANARVKLAKTGHGPHSSKLVICVVLLLFVLFYILFVCKCVLYYCHRVLTQLQLINTSISYHMSLLFIIMCCY